MNNCKNMGKKCEYADRLGMCENITATCARSRTMSRNLIDMDTLTEMIKRICCHAEDETDLLDALKEMPTIDAVEVVHGEWEVVDQEEPRRYGCSVCKRLSFYATNYCPCCGAKIDGVVKKDEQTI